MVGVQHAGADPDSLGARGQRAQPGQRVRERGRRCAGTAGSGRRWRRCRSPTRSAASAVEQLPRAELLRGGLVAERDHRPGLYPPGLRPLRAPPGQVGSTTRSAAWPRSLGPAERRSPMQTMTRARGGRGATMEARVARAGRSPAPGPVVADLARAAGSGRRCHDGGLPWNEGLELARSQLVRSPAAVLYLAGDLPLLTAAEVRPCPTPRRPAPSWSAGPATAAPTRWLSAPAADRSRRASARRGARRCTRGRRGGRAPRRHASTCRAWRSTSTRRTTCARARARRAQRNEVATRDRSRTSSAADALAALPGRSRGRAPRARAPACPAPGRRPRPARRPPPRRSARSS